MDTQGLFHVLLLHLFLLLRDLVHRYGLNLPDVQRITYTRDVLLQLRFKPHLNTTTDFRPRTASILAFTETWLNNNASDNMLHTDGFAPPLRLDGDSELTGKQHSGGVFLYVSSRWCSTAVSFPLDPCGERYAGINTGPIMDPYWVWILSIDTSWSVKRPYVGRSSCCCTRPSLPAPQVYASHQELIAFRPGQYKNVDDAGTRRQIIIRVTR
ncbi:hypothetical protein F2P81_023699 [Scophthalmus maximus]|uniref:Uncharacterized protein n=1 Tax=Scophthalmus maximus TaxID=52904 RepID=A0A6A4RS04_SCOMX|nr:hypothetical protein F2P81_023699 [Scophthalmus maximus]